MGVRGAAVNVLVTYKDYLTFPDDGKRYEIIDGEVYECPSPNYKHQIVLGNLNAIIRAHVLGHGLGQVVFAPFDVVMDEINVVQPDLLFISNARMKLIARTHVKGVPDLAVEVVSPTSGKRDRTLKLKAYEKHGVPHYWIVDPDAEEVQEHALSGTRYRLVARLAGPAEFRPRLFPGLTVSLAQVWMP